MTHVLRIEMMPIDELTPALMNPKSHDIGAIISSIERFGFVETIVMDERTSRLVAGHGRVEALIAMRSDGRPVPRGVTCVGDEWMVPVTRGWASRTDAEASAYTIASNRLVELGGNDEPGLAALLKELAISNDLGGTGYDGDDVDRMLAKLAAESAGGDEGDEAGSLVTCPECGHRFAN